MSFEDELKEFKRVQAKNARITSWVLGFTDLLNLQRQTGKDDC
jgi:hypothetical protein